MAADTGIKAHAIDNHLRVKSFRLGIGIQLVEIRYTDSKVGIGKELDGLCLSQVSQKNRDILRLLPCPQLFPPCAFQEQICEHLCLILLVIITSDYNAARMKVVIKCFGLTQEFRAENDVLHAILFTDRFCIAYRDCRLDDHQNIRVHLQCPLDRIFNSRCIKKVIDIIIVGGSRDNHKVGTAISCSFVRCSLQIKDSRSFPRLFEKAFNLIVLNRTEELIKLPGFSFRCCNRCDLMLLRQKHCERKTHITNTCNCNLHILVSLSSTVIRSIGQKRELFCFSMSYVIYIFYFRDSVSSE